MLLAECKHSALASRLQLYLPCVCEVYWINLSAFSVRLVLASLSLAFQLRSEFRFAHSDFAFRLRLHRVPFGLRSVPSLRLLASLSVPSSFAFRFRLHFRFPQISAFLGSPFGSLKLSPVGFASLTCMLFRLRQNIITALNTKNQAC